MADRMTREELVKWRDYGAFPITRQLATEALILRLELQELKERQSDTDAARAEAEALAAALTHYVNNCPRCRGHGVTAYNSVYEHGIQYMEPAECRTCAWARAALTAATPAGTGQEG